MTERGALYLTGHREGKPDSELLFDRRVDPGETFNLASREPEQAVRMRERLEKHLQAKPEAGVVEERVRINPRIAKRLRALGYLEGIAIEDGEAEKSSRDRTREGS